jgi:hypothetical protein
MSVSLAVANFHKRACKKEEFKFKKRFTVLNRFSKIKWTFSVKLKIIHVDYYFRLHQTQKKYLKYFLKIILHSNKRSINLEKV